MNNIDQLSELIPELIDEAGDEIVFSDRAKSIIREIADYARSTGAYERSKRRAEEFWSDPETRTAKRVYIVMLDRIANAPTRIHANLSVLLHIPTLDDIVNAPKEEPR